MTYADLYKAWATVLAAMLAALLLSTAAFSTGAEAQDANCKGDVVLDAGHGGTDPGAVNTEYSPAENERTITEKEETLERRVQNEGPPRTRLQGVHDAHR